jgi:predicted nuclease of predicted toxin-antitoxin system
MRILLDECLPVPMRDCLTSHECVAVSDRGWKGIQNGELLRLAEGQFDLFLTSDQNIRYQQNLTGRRIPILELSTNDLRRILAAASLLQSAINTVKAGEFRQIGDPLNRPRRNC